MKDFLGNELKVGDEVILIRNRYRLFSVARVTAVHDVKVSLLGDKVGKTTREGSQVILKERVLNV